MYAPQDNVGFEDIYSQKMQNMEFSNFFRYKEPNPNLPHTIKIQNMQLPVSLDEGVLADYTNEMYQMDPEHPASKNLVQNFIAQNHER